MTVKTINSSELVALRGEGRPVDLIDVRTPLEYRDIHADGARLVPRERLDPQAVLSGDKENPLYVICRTGNRARQACERLATAGLQNVAVVEGGILAWEAAGGPVVRGKRAIALERQVRIAAGSLVVIGAVLALTINLWFVLLAAFVGAGLVFAGITDTCGMGMLLARMPWNQVRNEDSRCHGMRSWELSKPDKAQLLVVPSHSHEGHTGHGGTR